MYSMLLGGATTLGLILSGIAIPFGLDANFFGISSSALIFILFQSFHKQDGRIKSTSVQLDR